MPENATDAAAVPIATHVINLLRVSAGMQRKAVAFLNTMEGELVTALTKSGQSVNKTARLQALLTQTNASIKAAYTSAKNSTHADLRGVARMEGQLAVRAVNAAIGVDVVSVKVPETTLSRIVDETAVLGHKSAAWWQGQQDAMRQKFTGVVQKGVYAGQSVDEMVRAVRGTAKNNFKDGIMETSRRNAETLVRSAVISISNQARLDSFEQMQDVIKGIEWVATLDGRTTPICRALDGKQWRLPDYEPVGHAFPFPGPTAHWNCRSTPVPVTRSWEELSGKKLPSLDGAEMQKRLREKLAARGWSQERIDSAVANSRASMDGQVSNSFNFERWLKTKPDEFANKLLGPGRFDLWKKGKLTLADMVNQDGRPLTLEQLKASIESGQLPPETTGANFLALASMPLPFTAAVQAHLDDRAATEIETIKRTDPRGMKARELAALADSNMPPSQQLATATLNAAVKAHAVIKARVVRVIIKAAVSAGSLDAGLQSAAVQTAIAAGGGKGAPMTGAEWVKENLNADEIAIIRESIDAQKAKDSK